MNVPVFDLHCDTAFSLLGDNYRKCGSLMKNDGHIDLERAGKLEGYAQFFACFTTETIKEIPAVELFEREMATIHREIERSNGRIRQAFTAEEIEQNYNDGIMSAILSIEGPAGFGYDHGLLSDLYLVGFRMSTLGWNDANPLTGSCLTGDGLTEQGRSYVKEAQRLGMLIDVSHISDAGFWDIIKISQGPIIASHSNSRSVCNVPRNITDDMFRAICESDGVVGINLYQDFLGRDADVDTVCDHVLHFLKMDPDGKHLSLGSDFDGCESLPAGICGIQDYPKIARRLIERGLDENILMNIFWNNAVGVMKQCSI